MCRGVCKGVFVVCTAAGAFPIYIQLCLLLITRHCRSIMRELRCPPSHADAMNLPTNKYITGRKKLRVGMHCISTPCSKIHANINLHLGLRQACFYQPLPAGLRLRDGRSNEEGEFPHNPITVD